MRLILLDENLSHKLRRLLSSHDVRTVAYQGWTGLSNGELLKAAELADFDVIITADQNIRYQQNRRNTSVAMIVLSDNDEVLTCANANLILQAIDSVKAGGLVYIDLHGRAQT